MENVAAPRGGRKKYGPPWKAVQVVQAVSVEVLAWGAKAVWMTLQAWDCDPERGCYLSAGQMGERLGMSQRTVEDHLQELHALRLYIRLPRGRRACLPPEAIPGVARPDIDTITTCRIALERHIKTVRSRRAPTAIPVAGSTAIPVVGMAPTPDTAMSNTMRGDGRGDPPLLPSPKGNNTSEGESPPSADSGGTESGTPRGGAEATRWLAHAVGSLASGMAVPKSFEDWEARRRHARALVAGGVPTSRAA